jgi:hypothetical protein
MLDVPALSILLHLAFGALVATLAHRWKGRSTVLWFVVGTVGTLLALGVLSLLPTLKRAR